METSYLAYQREWPPVYYMARSGGEGVHPNLLKLYGALFWVFRFLMRFTSGRGVMPVPQPPSIGALGCLQSRSQRRYVSRQERLGRGDDLEQRMKVSRMFSRGLSPRQYMEKKARLFVGGRVRAYGLRHWGAVLLRRARLTCYDHGAWRAPADASLGGGMWSAQLPPV